MAKILIVDDDPEILGVLHLYLEQRGHHCLIARRGQVAVQIIREERPDLVITDVMMPGLTGGALYELIRREFGPTLPVIVSTGTSLTFRADGDPLVGFYPKQDDYDELMGLIDTLLKKKQEQGAGT